MKIVLAFDSFKGSLTAQEAVEAVERGIRIAVPSAQVVAIPLADGGEGTARVLTAAFNGVMRSSRVHGPVMEPVDAEWGWIRGSRTAVIEMAAASGLGLVSRSLRNPMRTTTYGVGELILQALDAGAREIIVGVGGSATVDGGTGMAVALGARFEGCGSPMTGGQLGSIRSIDLSGLDTRLGFARIRVALDVDNPLVGSMGAAAVFGPQKGATANQVEELEAGLRHLASFMPETPSSTSGAGAAGGLGWGLKAFCGAELENGADLCMDAVKLDDLLEGADLVITGEGRFDRQSLHGKVPAAVARRASRAGVSAIVLAGELEELDPELLSERGIKACYSIMNELAPTREEAQVTASVYLERLAGRIIARHDAS